MHRSQGGTLDGVVEAMARPMALPQQFSSRWVTYEPRLVSAGPVVAGILGLWNLPWESQLFRLRRRPAPHPGIGRLVASDSECVDVARSMHDGHRVPLRTDIPDCQRRHGRPQRRAASTARHTDPTTGYHRVDPTPSLNL